MNAETKEIGAIAEEVVHVEVEIAERIEVLVLPRGETALVEVIREKLQIEADVHLFERDQDEPLERVDHHHRRHIRVVGHKCHELDLHVQYDHHSKPYHFRPSATVFKALQWAVGKHAYNLDPMQAAKANLILPGADLPLPREDVLGKYVTSGECSLVVDLTLKDFSNG